MANSLTLVLTIYNPKKRELKRWEKFSKKIKNQKNLFFSVINDNTEKDYSSFFNYADNYINNDKNVGKFLSVYSYVKNNNIKTTFFKTVDPDDYISYKKLLKFVKSDSYNDWNIVRMQPYKFRKLSWPLSFIKLYYHNEEARNFPTYSTILPTKTFIYDDSITKNDYTRNFIEDQLLGIISYKNGGKIINLNYSFYKYFDENGVTSQFTQENVEEIILSMETFWKICIKFNVTPPTTFPGNLDYIRQKANESKLIDLNLKTNNDKRLSEFTLKNNIEFISETEYYEK